MTSCCRKKFQSTPRIPQRLWLPRWPQVGADLIVDTLRGLQAGTIKPRPQDHAKATLAPILKKEDGRIDFRQSAQEICNRLRGFQPWPGAFTAFRGKNLHVWDAAVSQHSLPLGELLVDDDRLFVGCGGGTALALLEVQPEGKKHMAVRDFIHGYRPQTGEKLGSVTLRTENWMPISPARVAAFDILLRVEREDSYASELLHSSRYARVVLCRSWPSNRVGHGGSSLAILAGLPYRRTTPRRS